MDYRKILEEQLCIDYNCTPEELKSGENVFRPFSRRPEMRPVGKNSLLKICAYNEKLLVMADEQLLVRCREILGSRSGVWIAEPENIIELDRMLNEFGQRLADTHHHYIPCEGFPTVEKRFEVRWYERDEIEIFRGDGRFWEALLFDEETPDMLAVCAMDGEMILGMASVTRNCEKLWEIGVNVTPEGRGRGVGAYVTALLKERVLGMGIVPTYATVESHIKSQKVAFRAGFEPVFYEMFSE